MKIPKENIVLGITSVALFLSAYFFEKQLPFSFFQATIVIVLLVIPIGKWFITKKITPHKS